MINKIILASKSKVRKEILDKNNIENIVKPSNVDEDIVKESLIKEKASPEVISKNLAELKVYGPMLSIPVSCAIKVVPQIKVHKRALNKETVFDIILVKQLIYKQSFYLNFPLSHY